MQTDKIHRNNFNPLSAYNFNFYRSNIPKLHIKFFNQDFLYFQKKNFWCALSAMKHFFNNKKKLTLILYFNNLTKIEQHFFLSRNYRKYFFWWVCLLSTTLWFTSFCFLGQNKIANWLFFVFCNKKKQEQLFKVKNRPQPIEIVKSKSF